ncbi:MAG: aspartate aminotransferase family protein, partial [Bacillota bacterium]|nr:aspartate aminotransferase family protein [Bacillota bacterium]
MNSKQVMEIEKNCVMQTYGRYPVALRCGRGVVLYDFEGKEYIDFASGIGVNSVGYANEKWISAVVKQAGLLQHVSNLYYTEPMARLAERLTALTGMSRVFFSNSGSEANEGAIKLARKYSFDKYGMGRSKIISLINSFHGRTISTLAATGQDVFHNYFFPFTEDFAYVPANDIKALQNEMTENTCAVIIELVQGEGGVLPLERDYVKAAYELCRKNDVLFLADEVQTGVGRTGTFFAFQGCGITPDVVTAAKGLGGGLPIGAVIAAEKVGSVLSAGTHASTFGANPISCAAANAVLDIVTGEGFLIEVSEKGKYIKVRIKEWGCSKVLGVRGLGLMLGVEVPTEYGEHKALVAKMAKEGLLALTAGKNVIRLLPPLTISYEEIDSGL